MPVSQAILRSAIRPIGEGLRLRQGVARVSSRLTGARSVSGTQHGAAARQGGSRRQGQCPRTIAAALPGEYRHVHSARFPRRSPQAQFRTSGGASPRFEQRLQDSAARFDETADPVGENRRAGRERERLIHHGEHPFLHFFEGVPRAGVVDRRTGRPRRPATWPCASTPWIKNSVAGSRSVRAQSVYRPPAPSPSGRRCSSRRRQHLLSRANPRLPRAPRSASSPLRSTRKAWCRTMPRSQPGNAAWSASLASATHASTNASVHDGPSAWCKSFTRASAAARSHLLELLLSPRSP